jgi:ATP-dependent exoDNAse (exonuclease V) beta subunit
MTKLTRAQQRVVEHESGHLLVDAGAGSGKTTTVVQALCHQLGVPVIVDGTPLIPVATPLTFDQVAAITFTNQAAADLKRKLRLALRTGGRRDLSAEVDSARIGTIHGFCGDLLRDFALRAGARPGRRVLEEGEGAALASECGLEAVHAAIEAQDVAGLEALLAGRKLKDIGQWVAKLAEDTDRLARMGEGRAALRAHELTLLELAQRAAARRVERLERDGVLDFDQMIVAVRDLLSDDVVRHAVQQRIRLLVLDEFQDVDPVQRDIAFLLGGIGLGDPKQSIYRFRRADVTLWNSVAAEFATGSGTVMPLQENFRSKAAILAMVDAAVGPSLNSTVVDGGDRQPFEVDYKPLLPAADDCAGDHAVEFLVVSAASDGKQRKAEDIRDIEALEVARRVAELNAEGVPYGDVALLLAGWSAVDAYAGALRASGIPVYVLRSEGFWNEREVIDCLLALRAIRDITDDVAVAGFLKSPFIGVRDDTLMALAQAANGAPLASALDVVAHEQDLLQGAKALLDRFGALRDRVSTHVLLQRLLYDTGFMAATALHPESGAQGVANLRKLIRMAAVSPDQSLGEFLRMVAEQREREDRVAPERLYRERSDVVTITSVHSSKGLEWPVVFWCDLVRAVHAENDRLLVTRNAFCVKDTTLGDDDKDPRHTEVAALLKLEQQAEAYRLWYVASTRAKSRLILSGIPLGDLRKAVSPAAMLRERFPALDGGTFVEYSSDSGERYRADVRVCSEEPLPERTLTAASVEMSLAPAPVRVPSGSSRLSASQLMTFAHDPALWWERYVLRNETARFAGGGGSGAESVVQGLIVHDVLERLGEAEVELADLIEDAIAERDEDAPAAESPEGFAYRRYLRERVEAASASPVWQRVATGVGARRELGFTRVLAGGAVLSGAMDLAARDGAAAHILDVKTTSKHAGMLVERYAVQAAVYTDAVRVIGGASDALFTLLAVPAGESVEVASAVEVEALTAALRAFVP